MFSVCPHLGRGGGGSGPAGGEGGGGVRSVSRWGGQVQLGGGQSVSGGEGVSILRPLAGGMPLAFTQEDCLVEISGKIQVENLNNKVFLKI